MIKSYCSGLTEPRCDYSISITMLPCLKYKLNGQFMKSNVTHLNVLIAILILAPKRTKYRHTDIQTDKQTALPCWKLTNFLLFEMKLYLFSRSSCAHSCLPWPSACPWAGFDAWAMNGQLLIHCTDAALTYRLTPLGSSAVKHSQPGPPPCQTF